jgi:hypothetical protein
VTAARLLDADARTDLHYCVTAGGRAIGLLEFGHVDVEPIPH